MTTARPRIAGILLVIAAILRIPTLTAPLLETHAFRQTQTAFPAVIYAREGIDILRPVVPVFGPGSPLPFEFPLFQVVGALLLTLGIHDELALRSLALVTFLATATVLWQLVRRNVSERVALLALALFVFSPFSLLFSRAVLVEYTATLAALVFVYAALEYDRDRRRRWMAVAAAGGIVAALVKINTAAFWLLPALLTRRPAIIGVAGLAGIAGLAWTVYASTVRDANLYSASLGALTEWVFGGGRLTLDLWVDALTPSVQGISLLLLPLALFVARRPERRFWSWMAIAAVGPILAMTNLYAIHDYYSIAISPAIVALAAGGVDYLWTERPQWRPVAVALTFTGVLVSVHYVRPAYAGGDEAGVLPTVAEIETLPPGPIVVESDDWSPAPFFYGGREGWAIQRDVSPPPPAGYPIVQRHP